MRTLHPFRGHTRESFAPPFWLTAGRAETTPLDAWSRFLTSLAEFGWLDTHPEVVVPEGNGVPLLDGVVDELSVLA
jgi:hypothetical protein